LPFLPLIIHLIHFSGGIMRFQGQGEVEENLIVLRLEVRVLDLQAV
jgi:hypothetical protein